MPTENLVPVMYTGISILDVRMGTILHLRRRLCRLRRRAPFTACKTALVHESELARNDPNPEALHRPMLCDSGLPSSVI